MDPELRQVMKELGDAINEALSESKRISEIVSRLKERDYDMFLVLEAIIGVSKKVEESVEKVAVRL